MKIVSIIFPYYNRIDYLRTTVDSLEYFYSGRKDLQIVIVDDKSNDENNPKGLVSSYKDLQVKVIRIENKKGINPCYPINVGVRESDGDIIVLSSPEITHTKNIFEISNDFAELTDKNYLQFSVFCITDRNIREMLLNPSIDFTDKLPVIDGVRKSFYSDLGFGGYSYATSIGAWYTHSEIKNSCYNFLSACTRNTYYELNGFNEAFVKGTGYDDTDFRDRMLTYVDNNVIWCDECEAIHIDHPAVSVDNNTNLLLYNKLKDQIYEKNDMWGRLW